MWLLKGDLERHDKRYTDAEVSYTRVLKIAPKNKLALLNRAAVRAAASDNEGALVDLDAIGKAAQEDPRVLFLRAVIARNQGQPNAALRMLRQVLQVIPNHKQSLAQAAQIHFQLREFSRSKEYLERLLAIDPANSVYRKMLGAVNLAAGDLDSGLDELETTDVESLSDPQLLSLLGAAYLRHGKLTDGARSLERAAELAPESAPIRTQLAFSKLRAGKIDEALRELEEIRAEKPDFLLAAVLQSFAYVTRDQDAAVNVANTVISQHPESPVGFNLRGYLRILFKDSDAAREDLNAALAIDDAFHPARFNLARLEIAADDRVAATRHLDAVLAQAPNHPQALHTLAMLKLRDGEREEAVRLLEQARKQNPENAEARLTLARIHRQDQKLSAAVRMAEEAYALAPYVPEIQLELALIKLSNGEVSQAQELIEKVLERYPNSEKTAKLLSLSQLRGGEIDKLVDSLEDFKNRFPQRIWPRAQLAKIYLQLNDYDKAQEIVTSLRSEEASMAAGYILQGDIERAKNLIPAALASYANAHDIAPSSRTLLSLFAIETDAKKKKQLIDDWLSANPDDVAVRVTKATTDLSAGRTTEAIEHYEKALAVDPNNIIALNNLAWIFDELDDERALSYARRAFEAAPSSANVVDTYGWILLRKGNREQAVELLAKAKEIAPDNGDIRYHFASALAQTDDRRGAIKELDSLLKSEVQFAARKDAETLLSRLQR